MRDETPPAYSLIGFRIFAKFIPLAIICNITQHQIVMIEKCSEEVFYSQLGAALKSLKSSSSLLQRETLYEDKPALAHSSMNMVELVI